MAKKRVEVPRDQLGLPGMGVTPAEAPKTRGQRKGNEKKDPWAPPAGGWSWQRRGVKSTARISGEIEVDGKTQAAGGND